MYIRNPSWSNPIRYLITSEHSPHQIDTNKKRSIQNRAWLDSRIECEEEIFKRLRIENLRMSHNVFKRVWLSEKSLHDSETEYFVKCSVAQKKILSKFYRREENVSQL